MLTANSCFTLPSDLVPAEVVEKWVNFLRREFPCVAFKSSTQKSQAEHTSLGQSTSGSMKQTIEESQKERHTVRHAQIIVFDSMGARL